MRLSAVLFILALAPSALADTPPSVWERAKDPTIGKTWDIHMAVQGYFAAADQGRSEARRRDGAMGNFDETSLLERAKNLLEGANAATSSDVRLRFDYGLCLQRLKEYRQAATVLADVLAIAPWHSMATDGAHPGWLNYSFANAYLENPEEERRGYEKFLDRATEAAERLTPMLNLAEAEMHLGNLTESAHEYEAVKQVALSLPNEISRDTGILAEWGRAVALDRAGDFGSAARAADSAASMDAPPESSHDPYFAKAHLPASYSVIPKPTLQHPLQTLILDDSNVFFVPAYERKWYLALGETALARRTADPNIQLFHWRAIEKFWTDYVTEARNHKPANRFVGTAEKRLAAATQKREELEKRLHGRMDLPGPAARGIFIE